VRALIGLLRLARAYILQACAWQFNAGDWDWNVAMADLDTDGDGLLTVAEFLPPDPYLWRHDAPNMASAGEEVRNGLELLIGAFANRRGDSMIEATFGTEGADERLAKLRDLRTMVQREVTVTVSWTGGSGGGGARDLRMNLARLWSNPPDDLKQFLPTLELTEGGAWQALPRDIDDFPDATVNGLFPAPQPLVDIIVTGPDSVALSYGAIEEYPLIDRR
jgi:hypothetical protein